MKTDNRAGLTSEHQGQEGQDHNWGQLITRFTVTDKSIRNCWKPLLVITAASNEWVYDKNRTRESTDTVCHHSYRNKISHPGTDFLPVHYHRHTGDGTSGKGFTIHTVLSLYRLKGRVGNPGKAVELATLLKKPRYIPPPPIGLLIQSYSHMNTLCLTTAKLTFPTRSLLVNVSASAVYVSPAWEVSSRVQLEQGGGAGRQACWSFH